MTSQTASRPDQDDGSAGRGKLAAEFETAMVPLLQSLGAKRAQLIEVDDETGVATWLDAATAAKKGIGNTCGWLFRLAGHARRDALFVVASERLAPDDRRPLLAASLCRLAWRTFNLESATAVPTANDSAENESIHALRNSLNAALMNSAVLGAYAAELPQRLVPVAKQIESAVSRSSAELQRLVALFEARG